MGPKSLESGRQVCKGKGIDKDLGQGNWVLGCAQPFLGDSFCPALDSGRQVPTSLLVGRAFLKEQLKPLSLVPPNPEDL